MAEQEIIKHTKKAYAIFKSSDTGIRKKMVDISIEILIIVFAVSISIWLSNWSERRNEHKEEKEFFIGFKKDLQSEIVRMTNSKEFYVKTLHGLMYFINASNGSTLNKDSINKYSWIFFSSTDLYPHIGRYEGLKSSGKFRIIENKELLNNIINLQETIIQRIQTLNDKYYRHSEKLESLVEQNIKLEKNGELLNPEAVLNRSDMKILLSTSAGIITGNILNIHDEGISKCNEIIALIDQELKLNRSSMK